MRLAPVIFATLLSSSLLAGVARGQSGTVAGGVPNAAPTAEWPVTQTFPFASSTPASEINQLAVNLHKMLPSDDITVDLDQKKIVMRAVPSHLAVAQAMVKDMERLRSMAAVQRLAPQEACPVGFHVDRRGSFGLEAAKGPDTHRGPGLDLSFRSQKAIVEAVITVHGMDKGVHVVPAAGERGTDATEIFDLKGTAEKPLEDLPVWMEQLGMVNWAELTRVVYADGTSWTPTGEQRCTATPSLMVLVDGTAR